MKELKAESDHPLDSANVRVVTVNQICEAVVPTKVGTKLCSTLIDTGATKSCMSEKCYEEFQKHVTLPPLKELLRLNVRAATGDDLRPLGIVTLPFKIGDSAYQFDFIVCRYLRRDMILGIDFLRQNRIGTNWSMDGHFVLEKSENVLVQSVEAIEAGPQIKTRKNVTIPGRSLVILNMTVEFKDLEANTSIYDVKTNPFFQDEYPNLITVPTSHRVEEKPQKEIPHLIVNLDRDPVYLEKGTLVGFLEPTTIEIDQISTEEEYIESINCKMNEALNELEDKGVEINEIKINEILSDHGFILSPADVTVHRNVKLKDADVSVEDKATFEKLCEQYQDVFSKDSADIGRTPLIEMEIDTGSSPPVSQRPYNLPLKHVEWVHKEIETLEKAGVIVRSVSPWASPIVVVPKKSEPGEPPRRRLCVDYRAINSLLPKVDKAHSKAKGVLSLVPLPKIDEIYAKLKGSRVYSTFDMRSGYYHIALTKKSQAKSAFVIGGPKGGKYEFRVVPFGLAQAPAYFQQLVSEVLQGLDFAFGYLDDILIFSPDMETHFKHIDILFGRLREAQLKLKAEKCHFLKKHVQYLGHIISGEGLEPVPEKTGGY